MSENIIKTAREAGAWPQQKKNCEVEYVMSAESLKRFADKLFEVYSEIGMAAAGAAVDLAMAMEREQCAKICDHMAARCNDMRAAALESAADNIRARGNKT
jgi:hypothetical protein